MEEQPIEGTVIKSTGSWYLVRTDAGEVVQCRIKGKFRINAMRLTNPVAVGDRVTIAIEDEVEERGIIKQIHDRTNYIVRASPRRRYHLHLLAANVDQAVVLNTIREPNLKQGFIDRFLLMTEPFDLPVYIIFNKADLYTEDDLMVYGGLQHIYEDIGYHTLLTSTVTGQGMDELRRILTDKTTLVSGHSGVGKSTIINTLEPSLDIVTQEISDYSGKGQHTTTFAEMHTLSTGGQIIDTPGIKSLSFINMEPREVADNFREIFKYGKGCKYSDCLHVNEPKCAVKAAVESGDIHELRYHNYLMLLDETQEQNNWERNYDL